MPAKRATTALLPLLLLPVCLWADPMTRRSASSTDTPSTLIALTPSEASSGGSALAASKLVIAVPEPSSIVLLGTMLAVAGLALGARRRLA